MADPLYTSQQSNASMLDQPSTQSSVNTSFSTQSRRRPRPVPSSQNSLLSASNSLHPTKKVRQRSVSAQRELNASPEAMAAVAAATMDVSSIRSLQDKKKGSLVEWAKTTKYCVAQLTGLPMELRDSGDNYARRMSAITDQSSGNALLIKDHGVDVWRYDDVQLLPKPNHFPLPSDETHHHQGGHNSPQPLGSLVSPTGSSDEAGLVVVMPVTGRIAYWDSVSSAMTEGLLQRRRGVEGVLPLSSGEQAHMIANIEPAGFIICTNQNRAIHLSLRDGVGKPVVQLTTLKNVSSSVVGGLLGGIANAFKSGNVKKEIVAVRPGRIIGRAERELLVATSHGHITRWEVSRNGAAVVLSDVDMREQMLSRVLSVGPPNMQSLDRESFTILDIAGGQSTAEGANILILTSWDGRTDSGENITHYTLILVTLYRGSQFTIKKTHYLSCFHQSLRTAADTAKPRLYLPNPYRTAFVVFSRAVVLASIVPEDMYDLTFADTIPDVAYDSTTGFEEVIDFKAQSRVEIIGSGVEELTQEGTSFNPAKSFRLDSSGDLRRKYYSPGVVIITKGAGVLKLTVFDAETADLRPLPSPRPIPVKSKMELAVFFGTNEKNHLNFNGRREITYPTLEVQQAARNLSMDLMCSHGQYLATLGPSIDIYLESRAQKLLALAEYLRTVHRQIAREVRWKLLWDAEKMEAARAVYRAFAQKQSAGKDLSEGLLLEVVSAFFIKHDVQIGAVNPMVEWFAKHLPRIYELIPLLREAVKTTGGNTLAAIKKIHESNEITLTILATAHAFRVQHARLYSVDGELGENGIANFKGLESPPWTSGPEILTALNRDIEVNTKIMGIKKEGSAEEYFGAILDQMVDMVEVACRNFVERAAWCEVQGAPKYIAEGQQIKDLYLKGRNQWIRALAFHDRAEQAVDIAERYRDYGTLVELAFEELAKINGWLDKRGQEVGELEKQDYTSQRDAIVTRLEGYFEKFGQEFAYVLYEYQVETGNLRDLLVQFPGYKKYLDGFLQSEGRYSRVRWINEVRDGRYKEAGETLIQTADSETCLWSQAVELSIGKLALMASQPAGEAVSDAFDRRLKMVELQKSVQAHVSIEARGAIDVQAGTELAFGAFGGRLEPYQSLRDIFKRGVAKAVTGQSMDAEELVDFLTLMYEEDEDTDEEEGEKWAGRFQTAMMVLGAAEIPDMRKEEARRTIWRRMYMSEDWLDILDPSRQNTTQIETRIMNTNLFDVLIYGYKEGLFDEHKASTPLAPSQSGFTRDINFLASRFPGSQQPWLQNLYEEIKIEEREVQRLIDNNLEFWFPWMCETAMKMAAEEADETIMENGDDEEEEEEGEEGEDEGEGEGGSREASYEEEEILDAMDMS
ncbi:hypothetical protein TWF706_010537 [Orbilia oligospora]|uniref:Nucleoporin Nup133/Nup155-like C-terminal domain-containing protein n=1 Tax=Orbilia oligospora TaxID=2813651 RepID=A0A7C8NIN0_ORBOL|nr:hypothetical protein TWF706_010537 [Orbilia oligospora]KAF3123877.1 hypothetical protein TWF703_000587 [Orbilia oligospora]